MSIRFIHTADVHYGMENYGRIDTKTGIHSRLLDFHSAFNYCIDTAIEKQVDFFLFAGDAYKTTTPSPTQQKLMISSLLRLYEAKIPVILVIGNHDNPLSFGKAHSLDVFSELPFDGFHVIAKPQTVHLETKNGPVNIVGMPWPTRNTISLNNEHLYKSAQEITEYISHAAARIIKTLADELEPSIPAVLSGHLTISSGVFSGSEKRAIYGTDPIFLPSDLAIEPFDYVALGHLHRYQNLNQNGYPAIVYAGSVERIDFGERKEEKGFCLVTIEEKGKTHHEFIKTPVRPFFQIEVKIQTGSPQTEQVVNEIETYNLRGAIVKIVYHVPQDRLDKVDLQAVQRACSEAHYIVGIIPVHHISKREKRSLAKVDMDFKTLLTTYFDTKPALEHKKEDLINKALELWETHQKEVDEQKTQDY